MRIGTAERRQADEIEGRLDRGAVPLQDPPGFEAEGDSVPDVSPWKQRRILKHHDPRRKRSGDRMAVFAQTARSRRLKSGNQAQQCGFPAAGRTEQGDELAGLYAEADVVQNREDRTTDVEGMAYAVDIKRSSERGRRMGLGNSERYHLTTPFCQTSSRSRVRNSSVIA